MAEFDPAYAKTMRHEGGYANNPADRGGETYKGIARNFWRGWKGWPLVDAAKAKPGFPKSLASDATLQQLVADFYRRNFWAPWMGGIESQDLADWVFDKAVNMGITQAVKLLQRAAGVAADGQVGPKTMAAIQAADQSQLLESCREQARTFYRQLADNNPSQRQFLKGWLARA